MTEAENNDSKLSEEEIKQMEADIAKARADLVSPDTEQKIKQAKEEAKAEAEKEFLVNQKIKELEEEKTKLLEAQKSKEEETAKQLEGFKEKIDSLTSSQQPIRGDDPFKKQKNNDGDNPEGNVDKWTDDKVNDFERQSGSAFFGEGWD